MTSLNSSDNERIQLALTQIVDTIHRLRVPGGCPWDQEQTHQSLRPYLMEETYETLAILDQLDEVSEAPRPHLDSDLEEELGDVLFQILLHAEIARERKAFDIGTLAKKLHDKLVRRHPHVFTDQVQLNDSSEVIQNWEAIKAEERSKKADPSALSGIPQALPALQRTHQVIAKATAFGFQWDDLEGPLKKVDEELAELKKEIVDRNKGEKDNRVQLESELGDLLFSICNVAYLLDVSPEDSLRSTLKRFETRFRHLESQYSPLRRKKADPKRLEQMDRFWDEAKVLEKTQIWGLTGGIASGKSAAGSIFSKLGIPVVDADQVSRELSQEGGLAHSALIDQFGTADPSELRKMVFSNPKLKKQLEALLHPLIHRTSLAQFIKLAPQHSVIIYEASLLVETGRYRSLTGLIVIEASEELRLNRLKLRPNLNEEIAKQIIRSQLSNEERRKVADIVIQNTDSLTDLEVQISKIIRDRKWNAQG